MKKKQTNKEAYETTHAQHQLNDKFSLKWSGKLYNKQWHAVFFNNEKETQTDWCRTTYEIQVEENWKTKLRKGWSKRNKLSDVTQMASSYGKIYCELRHKWWNKRNRATCSLLMLELPWTNKKIVTDIPSFQNWY